MRTDYFKDCSSIRICTKNENGLPEIELEYRRGFIKWLFKVPAKIETYERLGSYWHEKGRISLFNQAFMYKLDRLYESFLPRK